MRAAFGWIGRRAIVYLLLVAALVAAASLLPWLRSEWVGPGDVRTRVARLAPVQAAVVRAASEGECDFAARLRAMRTDSVARLDARLRAAEGERAALIAARPGRGATLIHLATGDAQAVLADQRRELTIILRTREIASLRRAIELATAEAALASFADLRTRAREADRLRASCGTARAALAAFDRQWIGQRLWDRAERNRLNGSAVTACGQADRARQDVLARLARQRDAGIARQRAATAFAATTTAIGGEARVLSADLDRQLRDDRATIGGALRERLRVWAQRVDLMGKAWLAAGLLLVGIVLPYLVRTFCYYVLAPIAARRPAIRLRVPGGGGGIIPLGERSTTSVGIRLLPGEELLVRQDYLQASSGVGGKATRWLLDWRHPLTSMAAGLMFLTRVRGDGETTTISPVRDPFAEVTLVTLPAGAACVLHPRALAAVVQPIGQPLRITRHWRLGSLNAWLTLQLRFLVFHGPARLAVKGTRGVRIERAELGRVFGQDQLVGFSADLAYSVTRTEVFAPYLFGRESLLKDRVVGGEGVLIIEEAPMAGRGGAGARRGLEGAIDAVLKAVGI